MTGPFYVKKSDGGFELISVCKNCGCYSDGRQDYIMCLLNCPFTQIIDDENEEGDISDEI